MNEKKPIIETEHHKFLVALTHDEKDEPQRVVIEIDKTDTDELAFITPEKTYWVSFKQFMQLMKSSNYYKE